MCTLRRERYSGTGICGNFEFYHSLWPPPNLFCGLGNARVFVASAREQPSSSSPLRKLDVSSLELASLFCVNHLHGLTVYKPTSVGTPEETEPDDLPHDKWLMDARESFLQMDEGPQHRDGYARKSQGRVAVFHALPFVRQLTMRIQDA
jgi:hypothetical protein